MTPMVMPCSRSRGGVEPDDLLCSRNARPQKALVGGAQRKILQPPSVKSEQARSSMPPIPLETTMAVMDENESPVELHLTRN
jgi:hypothetical protein